MKYVYPKDKDGNKINFRTSADKVISSNGLSMEDVMTQSKLVYNKTVFGSYTNMDSDSNVESYYYNASGVKTSLSGVQYSRYNVSGKAGYKVVIKVASDEVVTNASVPLYVITDASGNVLDKLFFNTSATTEFSVILPSNVKYLYTNIKLQNGACDMATAPKYAAPTSTTPAVKSIETIENNIATINDSLDSLKKSVSDGKTLVANAITAKGISTATDATFETIANNVNSIVTGMVGAIFQSFSWSNDARYAGNTSMSWNLYFDISICKTINLSIANGSSSRGSNTTSVYAKKPDGSWVGVGRSFTNDGYTQLRIAVSYTDATDTSNWGINSNGSCSISTT